MILKSLFLLLGVLPILASAQSVAPAGVNAERYSICMRDGIGKGRSYATPEAFCQEWAGRARNAMQPGGNEVPCGMNFFTEQPIYMSWPQCKAQMQAMREYEIQERKAAAAKAAAAAAAAKAAAAQIAATRAKLHLPNGNFMESCQNYMMDGSALIALCLNESGQWGGTVLVNASSCQNVQNINGNLTCN